MVKINAAAIEKKAVEKLALLQKAGVIATADRQATVNGVSVLSKVEQAVLRKKAATKQTPPKKIVKPAVASKKLKTKVFGKKKEQRKIVDTLTAASIAVDPVVRRNKATGPKTAHTLRKSIVPGTVLILLAGKFAGKRAVFLKQLPSGLLLVSGPFKVNGVPLRRVSQKYVIATSTKVDVSGVKVPETVTDKYFVSRKKDLPRGEKLFFKGGVPVNKESGAAVQTSRTKNVELAAFEASEERKKLQESVDAAIIAAVQKVEFLGDYLKSTFSLTSKDAPHKLKF